MKLLDLLSIVFVSPLECRLYEGRDLYLFFWLRYLKCLKRSFLHIKTSFNIFWINNLPKDTQLVNSRVWIWTQANFSVCSLYLLHCFSAWSMWIIHQFLMPYKILCFPQLPLQTVHLCGLYRERSVECSASLPRDFLGRTPNLHQAPVGSV